MPNIDTGLFINTGVAADRATAAMARRVLSALLASSGTTGQPSPGIIGQNGGGLAVSSASTSALLFNVAAGYAVTVRSASPALGGYLCGSTTVTQVTLTAANASNPRIDIVYICQPDPEAGDSTHARIDVVTGTPAASPAAPTASLPQGALSLATVLVPAAATAASACTITDTRTIAAVANGLPVYANTSALPTTFNVGQRAVVQQYAGYVPIYNVTMRAGANGWKPWESDWTYYNGQDVQGIANGYASSARVRFVGGEVLFQATVLLNNGGSYVNNSINMVLPVPRDTTSGSTGVEFEGGWQGRARALDASDGYRSYFMDVNPVNNNYLQVGPENERGMYAATNQTNPFTWAQSDQISLSLRYQPA